MATYDMAERSPRHSTPHDHGGPVLQVIAQVDLRKKWRGWDINQKSLGVVAADSKPAATDALRAAFGDRLYVVTPAWRGSPVSV